ncbi:hypothetical protein ACFLIM_34455 [Nonomuraea sp. M3C6]|uniref:Sensor histidine kinase n=1 Tax=Nonomuraea marmarensis TaxID=3351344 RepID=A0ABW7ALP2_9ACTN
MMDIPLRLLRYTAHATACGLLVIAVLTVLRADRVPEAVGGVLLGLVYAAGPIIEARWPRAQAGWLAVVTAGWVVLGVMAPPFVWLAFPLLFAYLHLLPLWGAMFGVTVLTSAAILAAAWHAGELSAPLVVGPGVAAVVVTLLALTCKALSE